jgi:HSP20 family protein
MSPVPPSPIEPEKPRDGVENALDHWFSGTRGWLPPVDLVRQPGKLILRADVPGLKAGIEDYLLTISREREASEEEEEEEEDEYLRRERRYGSFSSSMAVPGRVDPSKIDVRVEQGIAEVVVPLPASET